MRDLRLQPFRTFAGRRALTRQRPAKKPTTGIEPATSCLRSRCSTTKLHRLLRTSAQHLHIISPQEFFDDGAKRSGHNILLVRLCSASRLERKVNSFCRPHRERSFLDSRRGARRRSRPPLHIHAVTIYSMRRPGAHKTVWPSGLRRWLKAPVRKGVGSNPTAVIIHGRSPLWRSRFIHNAGTVRHSLRCARMRNQSVATQHHFRERRTCQGILAESSKIRVNILASRLPDATIMR